jgi:3-oxoacyl-[acyl-carrier-protein] synthase II
MMNIYINGIGSISAQQFDTRSAQLSFQNHPSNRLMAIEPDYKDLMPPMQLRRMSKVVKIGIASAKTALKDAGIEKPDIITTGTAYGCLADTEVFLQKMITQNETLLTPTAFIQSTHNTVSGQIALMLKCHGHNFTYVQKGHSFESSLQESIMWLNENNNLHILTGGIDEMTDHAFNIIARFGTYKNDSNHYTSPSEGTIAGEGAHLFVINTQRNEKTYAQLVDMKMCITNDIPMELESFLSSNSLKAKDIDTCFVGINGDNRYDETILNNVKSLSNCQFVDFKKWCGEYPTSGSFALALACNQIYHKKIDSAFLFHPSNQDHIPKNVLIYNHYKNNYHSFILLKSL